MDGIAFCQKIKEDLRLNHIPVILLTARAGEVDKIKGFETGADDYIIKPFKVQELLSRISNILKQRKILRERLKKDLLLETKLVDETSADEHFILKAKKIIQDHLADYEFTVEKFAADLALSRFHLNRKLQQIAGLSASRFIREIRLRTAAGYIKLGKGNISEIALEVGLDNFAYFNRCFKEKYGCAPSKY
jgi:DNA-binding response OmpR family regulator